MTELLGGLSHGRKKREAHCITEVSMTCNAVFKFVYVLLEGQQNFQKITSAMPLVIALWASSVRLETNNPRRQRQKQSIERRQRSRKNSPNKTPPISKVRLRAGNFPESGKRPPARRKPVSQAKRPTRTKEPETTIPKSLRTAPRSGGRSEADLAHRAQKTLAKPPILEKLLSPSEESLSLWSLSSPFKSKSPPAQTSPRRRLRRACKTSSDAPQHPPQLSDNDQTTIHAFLAGKRNAKKSPKKSKKKRLDRVGTDGGGCCR